MIALCRKREVRQRATILGTPQEQPVICGCDNETLWKGHTVGTNRSIDQQEVAFQNNCTWLMLPKYTQSGVYLTYQFLFKHIK